MHIGTLLYTWAKGRLVGTDEFGNRYYTERKTKTGIRPRRWVIYKDAADASRVPASWHGWLHYSYDDVLDSAAGVDWTKPHQPNMTGTSKAYLPSGHDRRGGVRPHATGDYEAWQP